MKKEIRIIGIDDGPFDKRHKKDSIVIGTVFRGGSFCDGVLSTKIKVDGNDSTDKIIKMINKSKFKPQLQCILLDGIAVGGFNVIDVQKLYKKTDLPVIVIMRDMPDFNKIISALNAIQKANKICLLKKAGPITKAGNILIQNIGISIERAKEIIRITSTRSFIPEPIRLAHLIAAGVVKGESGGKA